MKDDNMAWNHIDDDHVKKFAENYDTDNILTDDNVIIGVETGISIIISAVAFLGLIEGIVYIVRGKRGFYETYDEAVRGWF